MKNYEKKIYFGKIEKYLFYIIEHFLLRESTPITTCHFFLKEMKKKVLKY